MKLELNIYNGICEARVFLINGKRADYRDFGDKYDLSPDPARPQMCGNMVFEANKPTQQVLDRYGITVNEYSYICNQLKEQITFGLCRLCG